MASPSTGNVLSLKRPRTHKGLFRSEFYAVVSANDPGIRTLELGVADYREVGIPGGQLKLWNFALGYDFIKSAQVFTVPPPMMATTALTSLVADRLSKGSAPKLSVMPYFYSAPIDLT